MTRTTWTMAMVAFITIVVGIIDLQHDKINIMTIVMAIVSVLYFSLLYKEKGFNMFNFANWRKPKETYPIWADIPPIDYGLPKPKEYPKMPETELNDDGYTVGVNDEGKTIVKVTCNYSTTTMTMTQEGVRQMIRLLEATLQETASEK